jgi:RNA recognition motif-containing protein
VINIFVRNLDPTTTEIQLKDLFAAYGSVETVTIVTDRDTEGPRGFAFVEMTHDAEARAAIESLNGFVLNERANWHLTATTALASGSYQHWR